MVRIGGRSSATHSPAMNVTNIADPSSETVAAGHTLRLRKAIAAPATQQTAAAAAYHINCSQLIVQPPFLFRVQPSPCVGRPP